jgi:hypothetical protein
VIAIGLDHDGTKRRAHSDYVVRTIDGRNLLIIEVKAPDEPLNEQAREQGISYARLLRKGGIAPFVILTTGLETQVIDTISGELINGASIPINHPTVMNGFRITADDLALRAHALEKLISLSPENLLTFCRGSVNHHIQLLRSNDLSSGKKYIPQLYIERNEALTSFQDRLRHQKHPVLLVAGKPQVGKTNFLCKQVETFLENGKPCLFYPAISMQGGLLGELTTDFEWLLGDSSTALQIARKLDLILGRSNLQLTIFVDGLNEADATLAHAISENCKKLSGFATAFVVSFTSSSAPRLLSDHRNNPNYLGEGAGLPGDAIPLIDLSPGDIPSSANVVILERYSEKELDSAYALYSRLYQVAVPEEHIRTDDPFLLGIAMRLFEKDTLPSTFDEPGLLRQSLEQKARRAGRHDADTINSMLTVLARALLESDKAIPSDQLRTLWNLPLSQAIPQELYEAALITRTMNENSMHAISFYFERERDFVVSQWVREWPERMAGETATDELGKAILTRTGRDALRWFFTQPLYLRSLTEVADRFKLITEPGARQLILECVSKVVCRGVDGEWISKCIHAGLTDSDNRVKIEASKLLCLLSADWEEEEKLAEHISADADLIAGLLTVDEEYPLKTGSAGQVVLRALRSVHWDLAPEGGPSEITKVLSSLIRPSNSRFLVASAATALGYVAPEELLSCLCQILCIDPHQATLWNWERDQLDQNLFSNGIDSAVGALNEYYFGHMCPGYMNVLEDDPAMQAEEWERMSQLCTPVIRKFGPDKCRGLLDILSALSDYKRPKEDLVAFKASERSYQTPP